MPKAGFPVRAGNVIFCEDVRQEMLGKYSALGIYAGDIIPGSMTGHIKMALYMELFPTVLGQFGLDFTLTFGRQLLMRGQGELQAEDLNSPAVLATPSFSVALTGPGTLALHLEYEGRRKLIAKKEIREAQPGLFLQVGPQAAPEASPPPKARRKAKQP